MIKRIIFLVLMFVVFSGETQAAVEIEPTPSIKHIIVYPDSAMIKKQAVFPVKKGQNIIRISGITPNMVDASIQTSIKGGAGVKIADVKVEKTYLAKLTHEKTKKLKERLEKLEELIKTNTNEITVLNSSTDYLKKVAPFPQNQKITTSEIDAHVKFFTRSLSENYEKIAKAEVKLKKVLEEKKAVESELRGQGSSVDESKRIVIYLFSHDDGEKITMIFSYIVSRAGWFPQYDLRADSGANIAIDCFATIKQSTGEDWKGVDMEISTAKPFVYGTPPVLSSWFVDIYQPRPVMYKSARMKGFEDADKMPSKSMITPEKVYEQPQVKAEASSFSFVLPRKVDVPSDNQPHKIMIASASKEYKFNYYAVPRLSKYSYLQADLKNPFRFPLMKGRTNIFLDNRLVGSAYLKKTMLPDEDITLSLGVDEGIKVEKKLVKKFTESAGAFIKETRVTYEFAIDIFNAKDREINLTVKDNIPVSQNEKIKIEIESPQKDEAKISDNGIIAWDLKLAGGEKKSLNIKFRVAYPKNLRIKGLE